MSNAYHRRDVLKLGSLAGLAAAGAAADVKPMSIGLVGVGGRGSGHLRNLLRMEGESEVQPKLAAAGTLLPASMALSGSPARE